jgi:hypothetical protein
MADYEATGEALQKLVRLGKKQSMPFAFCPSKGDDESLFATHRKRAPDIIAKAARKASGQTKVCYGTFTVTGKLMTLTLIQELPAIAKKLKKHLRRERLSLNIQILDASGNELEADIEDLGPEEDTDDSDLDDDFDDDEDDSENYDASESDDDSPTPIAASEDDSLSEEDTPDDAETEPVDAAALLARIAALEPQLDGVPAPAGDKLRQALGAVTALINAGTLPRAATSLAAVEEAFARVIPNPPPQPDDEALHLAQRLTKMQAELTEIGEPALGKLTGALVGIANQIKAGDLTLAAATMDKITPALETFKAAAARKAREVQPEETAQPPADATPLTPEEQAAEDAKMADRWQSVSAKLEPVVLSTLRAGHGDSDAIRTKFAAMQDLAAKGQAKEALAQTGDLSRMLREAQAENTAEAAPDYPADAMPFIKSRSAWLKTRDQLRAEIGRLQTAMNEALAGVDGMEQAIAETGKLFDYIESLDIRLIGTLDSLVVEPEGPGREKLKNSARSIIAEYSAELDSPFFVDVDANNGFAPVKVRVPAMTVLKQVSAALA